MIWDQGTYDPIGDDPHKGLEKGKLHVALHGSKLEGEWTLVRMKPREGKRMAIDQERAGHAACLEEEGQRVRCFRANDGAYRA